MLEKLFKIFCAVFFIAFITSIVGVLIWACFTHPEAILIPVLGLLSLTLLMIIPAIMDTGYDEVMSWFKPNNES